MNATLDSQMKNIVDIDPLFGLLEGATLGMFGQGGYTIGVRIGAKHARVGVAYVHAYQVTDRLLEETYDDELSEIQQGNTVLFGGLLRRIFYNATMDLLEEYPDNTFELMMDEHETLTKLEECIITNHLTDVMWKRSTEFLTSSGYNQLTHSMDAAEELVSILLGKVIGFCERFAKKSHTMNIEIDYDDGVVFDAHLCKLFETRTPIFAKQNLTEPLPK